MMPHPHHETPFEGLSETVRSLLLRAGWVPDASRRNCCVLNSRGVSRWVDYVIGRGRRSPILRCTTGWLDFVTKFWPKSDGLGKDATPEERLIRTSKARILIDELFGLRVTPLPGEILRSCVVFDPQSGVDEADYCRGLGDLLGEVVIPVGEVQSESIILCGENGNMYLLGLAGRGVFRLGDSVSQSLESLLMSRRLTPLRVPATASSEYRFQD